MSINKLTSIVRRGSMFVAVFAIAAATFAPATATFADALNPLTNRSLTLSSSAPGWDDKDGSGNSTYAPPNSGANGRQTGNTFAFNVSSTQNIKGFNFAYCTTSAGDCTAPGDNGFVGTQGSYSAVNPDSATTSNLKIVTATPTELTGAAFTSLSLGTGSPVGNADTTNTPATITGAPARNNSQGNFVVLTQPAAGGSWTQSTGWAMATSKSTDGTIAAGTNKDTVNEIQLTNSGAGAPLNSGDAVKVIFFGTDTNYITNPGSGAFFVKINDYKDTTFNDANLVDGGVTVANVMNQSIEIQTKVLETMDFSVGTVDPYTLASDTTTGSQLYAASHKTKHGQCDPILTSMTYGQNASTNVLQLGDTTAENSLRTDATYSTHSFWRLSSNSSAGATVYYSGVTLKNTVGDQIAPIGNNPSVPLRGTPQFGLAIANAKTGNEAVSYTNENDSSVGKGLFENGADITTNGVHSSVATDTASLTGYHAPQLAPLTPTAAYTDGAGVVNDEYGTVNGQFAFDPNANIVPTPLATEDQSVVDCVTAKVRYIANIAATTPAGIYTTKINYIAAPQY